MLIVPELHAIFLFPPRTGSDTLMLELMRMHPNAYLLYRHAEATLVPPGYESWRKVGFVRDPLARLWSLFKFQAIMGDINTSTLQAEIDRIAGQVANRTFEDWVLNNDGLFLPEPAPIPVLYQAVHEPETRKSQWQTLRPDLGTVVLRFEDLPQHMKAWGLNPAERHGHTPTIAMPKPSKKLKAHMKKYFKWDLEQGCADV